MNGQCEDEVPIPNVQGSSMAGELVMASSLSLPHSKYTLLTLSLSFPIVDFYGILGSLGISFS